MLTMTVNPLIYMHLHHTVPFTVRLLLEFI